MMSTTARSGVAVLVALGTIWVVAAAVQDRSATRTPGASWDGIHGTVVDERGRAVEDAVVELSPGLTVHTDEDGRFQGAAGEGARLIKAEAEGHLSRTQAAAPGTPVEVVLAGRAQETVSLRFGGDVMFGRRYFDRNEDGDRGDGVLPPGASAADHAELLTHVRPLLEDADLTVVNLETPLVEAPFVDPTSARPRAFHPTKEYVFASAPESAQALLDVGVDAVSLGNNHVVDALDAGLATTLDLLDQAGLPRFGAGMTVDEAWAPAYLDRKGQRFAYLSCTTITGTEHAITYVADEQGGGAAQCTRARLDQEVRSARAQADTVVVLLHGGEEYEAEQTELVRSLTRTAEQAGAALVVNGHPHVVGGVDLQGDALVAETMGNLLFDQTVWPTFLSYLLRVDVRAGTTVLATVDPLLLEHEVPRPTVGWLADAAGRRAAGLLPGAARLRGPGALIAPGWPSGTQAGTAPLPAGTTARLAPGRWVDTPPAGVSLGEELLWTGSFEDLDTDPATSGVHHWTYGEHVSQTGRAACSGGVGMELRRSPASVMDVVLTPTHRQLVRAGTAVSLMVDVRGASDGATLELALYDDTEGPSSSTLRVPVPSGEHDKGACRRVRLDAVTPPGTVAVQPFLRLAAPAGVQRAAHLRVDDVELVAWAPAGEGGRRYAVVEAHDDVELAVLDDRPGSGGSPFAQSAAGRG